MTFTIFALFAAACLAVYAWFEMLLPTANDRRAAQGLERWPRWAPLCLRAAFLPTFAVAPSLFTQAVTGAIADDGWLLFTVDVVIVIGCLTLTPLIVWDARSRPRTNRTLAERSADMAADGKEVAFWTGWASAAWVVLLPLFAVFAPPAATGLIMAGLILSVVGLTIFLFFVARGDERKLDRFALLVPYRMAFFAAPPVAGAMALIDGAPLREAVALVGLVAFVFAMTVLYTLMALFVGSAVWKAWRDRRR